MSLSVVPSLLRENSPEKYEEIMNDLLNFMDEWHGQYDQKALRIVLASCFIHLFTNEEPIWIWLNVPARKFDTAIASALGRLIFAPAAGTIANELKGQTSRDKSLWVLARMEGMFHRTPAEIEVSMRQLADMEHGELEWHPRGIELDGRQGPTEPFVWNGRITVIASAAVMNRIQFIRCIPAWPICQNTFVNVRMRCGMMSAELTDKWCQSSWVIPNHRVREYRNPSVSVDEWVVEQLRLRLVNLMDLDSRNPNHRTLVPTGFFDSLTCLATAAGAIRGAGFDQDSLFSRAVRLSCAHARMMGKPQVDSEDLQLGRKVLLDAIPPPSIPILKAIPLGEDWWHARNLVERSHAKPSRVEALIQRLLSSGSLTLTTGRALHRWKEKKTRYFRVTPELGAALLGFSNY
jgi:hypothetical protein